MNHRLTVILNEQDVSALARMSTYGIETIWIMRLIRGKEWELNAIAHFINSSTRPNSLAAECKVAGSSLLNLIFPNRVFDVNTHSFAQLCESLSFDQPC